MRSRAFTPRGRTPRSAWWWTCEALDRWFLGGAVARDWVQQRGPGREPRGAADAHALARSGSERAGADGDPTQRGRGPADAGMGERGERGDLRLPGDCLGTVPGCALAGGDG